MARWGVGGLALPGSLSDLRWLCQRRPQKPRFLRPGTKAMSEKAPQATFSH
jgi:hypothetical protein